MLAPPFKDLFLVFRSSGERLAKDVLKKKIEKNSGICEEEANILFLLSQIKLCMNINYSYTTCLYGHRIEFMSYSIEEGERVKCVCHTC